MTAVYKERGKKNSSFFAIAYSLPKPSYWKDVTQHREYMFLEKHWNKVLKACAVNSFTTTGHESK